MTGAKEDGRLKLREIEEGKKPRKAKWFFYLKFQQEVFLYRQESEKKPLN